MNSFNITLFFSWYFNEVPKKIYQIWVNFLWFFQDFFSLSTLLKTFFAPWKQIYYVSSGGFNISNWFGNTIFNTFSRLIGMILRLIVILFGTAIEILVLIGGIVFFLLWLIFPFALIFCLIKGIILICTI